MCSTECMLVCKINYCEYRKISTFHASTKKLVDVFIDLFQLV